MVQDIKKVYLILAHKFVSNLSLSGLEDLAKATDIPVAVLNDFETSRKLDESYASRLYGTIFNVKGAERITQEYVDNFLRENPDYNFD